MKDISKFSDDFETIITECKKDEDAWYEMEEELNKVYAKLAEKNIERVNKLKNIRIQKLEEIDKELNYYDQLNKNLIIVLNKILKAYCEKNGHKDIIVGCSYLCNTRQRIFGKGQVHRVKIKKMCSLCERESWSIIDTTSLPSVDNFQKIIPEDINEENSFNNTGRTYEDIINEINNNNSYIEYLKYLKECICELFGHEGNIYSSSYSEEPNYKCEICGKIIPGRTYETQRLNPIYKGVVLKWNTLYYRQMIINKNEDLVFSLPTYEEYLSIQKEGKEQEGKSLVKTRKNK